MADPVTLKTLEAVVASYGLPGALVFWMAWQYMRSGNRSDPGAEILKTVSETRTDVKLIIVRQESFEKQTDHRLKRIEEWQDRKDSAVQHFTDRTIPPR